MARKAEFWFDVGSPYAYLGWCALPRLQARTGVQIERRPMLLGAVFKATGNRSPVEVPAKSRWLREDLLQWADHFQVPFRFNPHFPINTLTLMRGAIGFRMQSQEALERYLEAVFPAIWADQRNLGDAQELTRTLEEAGLDTNAFSTMVEDPVVKETLKRDSAEAVERGVFGAPTFFVGERMFWGQDRVDFVAEALGKL